MSDSTERKYVRSVFRKYKDHLRLLTLDTCPIISSTHQITPASLTSTLTFNSEVVQKREEACLYINKVVSCVNELNELERQIIFLSNMQKEKPKVTKICLQTWISKTYFFTIQGQAIAKLNIYFSLLKL